MSSLPSLRALLGKRARRILLWTLGPVLAWSVLVGLVAPPILRAVLESQLSQALSNRTSLGSLRINPFTLRVRLTDIAAPLPDGGPFARADLLELRLSPLSAVKLAPMLTGVRLTNPDLTLTLRKDGRLSAQDFAAGESQQAEASKASDKLFALVVSDLEIVNGRLTFRNEPFQTEHVLSELNLRVPLASTREEDRDEPIVPRLSALLDGKPLELDASLVPFAARGRNIASLRLSDLPVTRLNPYLQRTLPLHLANGGLSLELGLGLEKDDSGNPHTLLNAGLRLLDLELLTPAKGPLLRLPRADAGLSWDISGTEGLVISKVDIQGPELHLARKQDGGLELLDWLPAADPAGGKSGGKPLSVRLKELNLRAGRIFWLDHSLPGPFSAEVRDLSLDLSDFSTAPGASAAYSLSCALAGGGTLASQGRAGLTPLSLEATLKVEALNLAPFAPLLRPGLPLALDSGVLRADGRLLLARKGEALDFSLEDAGLGLTGLALRPPKAKDPILRLDSLLVAGISARAGEQRARSLTFSGLGLLDRGASVVQIKDLACLDLALEPGGDSYALGSAVLTQPLLNLSRDKSGQLNLLRLLEHLQAKDSPATEPAAAGPRLRLGRAEIQRGRVQFKDASGVQARVDNIAVQAQGFDSAGNDPTALRLEALVNGSPLRSGGALRLAPEGLELSLESTLDALDLTPLSPLAQRFLGYSIAQGRLSLDSALSLRERNLNSSQRIRLLNFDLGERTPSPEAINAPVQLGLSLLKDSSNNIDIELPVNGSLDNPEFGTGAIVREAMGNLLLSVVTSPFAIIGKLLGAGASGSNLEYVAFDPGDDRLIERNRQALKQVAELLGSRSSLSLGLIPHVDENDRQTLGEAYIHRRMQEEKFQDLPRKEQAAAKVEDMTWDPGQEATDLLFAVYRKEPFKKPRNLIGLVKELPYAEMYKAIDESRPRDQEALQALAQARAEAVRDALLALDPGLAPRMVIKPAVIPGTGPRVQLGAGK